MQKKIRIGTRESQLAVWQATHIQNLLLKEGIGSELVYIKSEGDIDLVTPLYAIGVQGVFTKALDAALLANQIDIAVHSMKDVPVQLAKGVQQAAILKRASYKDVLVYKGSDESIHSLMAHPGNGNGFIVATSSIRRKAQWLNRYPNHSFDNLRGNVNTRLKKLQQNNWNAAIFAAAGLERINLRPENSIELDWMLPAPAQGAIMVVCRENEPYFLNACKPFHDEPTAICVEAERKFLQKLMGGCSTPISALAVIEDDVLYFNGNICSVDGKQKFEVSLTDRLYHADIGFKAAEKLLESAEVKQLIDKIRND